MGILQEQHPRRAELFTQWKQLKFPLLADPLNKLDVAVVPITLLVDQHGIIRYRNPNDAQLSAFLQAEYKDTDKAKATHLPGQAWSAADRLVMQGKLRESMTAYQKLIDQNPGEGRLHFRLGVAYRMAFDAGGEPKDFTQAVESWKQARKLNGGQYIWRRRIQQYGPLPDKPYPFYDWVKQATEEIQARGEKPIQLKTALSVSERAGRRASPVKAKAMVKPSTDGIPKDLGSIDIQPVILPATSGNTAVVRVHLLMRPKPGGKHIWNNEAGPVKVWLEPSGGSNVSRQGMEIAVDPTKATSSELRSVEFEWHASPGATLTGYAIYHVCNKKDGQCSELTQAFKVNR